MKGCETRPVRVRKKEPRARRRRSSIAMMAVKWTVVVETSRDEAWVRVRRCWRGVRRAKKGEKGGFLWDEKKRMTR